MTEHFLQSVRFDERGLITAVVQDAETNEIIAVRSYDKDTLARSLQTGAAEFYDAGSSTREYPLVDVRVNPDSSSLTILILRDNGAEGAGGEGVGAGVAQTEVKSSTLRTSLLLPKPVNSEVSLVDVSSMEFGLTLNRLYALIAERNDKRPEGSYTTYLFNSGLDKILKKIAEESGEVIISAKNESSGELISELADLFYHLLVLMVQREVSLSAVGDELTERAARKQPRPSDNA
ncbi:MAG: phosphoribosyl-ATP diphosphatase [Blastocatellia bacterium]